VKTPSAGLASPNADRSPTPTRRPASATASANHRGASYSGLAKNIGPGGVFVATVHALGVGERVTVILQAKRDAAPIEALAEVRWCRSFVELDDLPAGVGLQFIDTPLRAAILANELRRSTQGVAAFR